METGGAFEGQVAVITGAASGLGRGIADRFGAAGCRLVLADVEEAALAQATAELTAAGTEVTAVPTDVADAASMDTLGDLVLERHGHVDLLFNNAGVGIQKPTAEMTTRDWEWVLGVNLWGVIHGLRVFLPHMLARDAGRIVNTASSAGHVVVPNLAAYNASKHAVVAISETVRAELRQRDSAVGVTAFCPGVVRTRITSSARNRPERLRNPGEVLPEKDAWDAQMTKERQEALESRFGRAKPAAEAADILHDGLLEGRFYVWTDDIFIEPLRRRHAEIHDSFWEAG
ncbi:MAG: SDR family NAD(P)-dependent oxidoreductase [Acidimicrobiia bacterium]|nr:SDR family NAD(P)-dependent oxidoreductase [Acidimicrobiia bacterium]MYC44890.1 SDR family NAD(P)-dependent oxidoreductase [Acidimicrobiia bacterium]MYI19671.1 SDR family NAD(P)-dependent oxidoreductase [Acidimicrobiia bacterium]